MLNRKGREQWVLSRVRVDSSGFYSIRGIKGTRAFVNMLTAMYMYEPSPKYPIAHPRAFAACSVAGDPHLNERFCCWACRRQSDEGEVKSLWPSMSSFYPTLARFARFCLANGMDDSCTLGQHLHPGFQDLAWETLG